MFHSGNMIVSVCIISEFFPEGRLAFVVGYARSENVDMEWTHHANSLESRTSLWLSDLCSATLGFRNGPARPQCRWYLGRRIENDLFAEAAAGHQAEIHPGP